jgi:hypothetical protein
MKMYSNFLAKQTQLEEKLAQWQKIAGTKMQVEHQLSYSGHKVYAITLTDFSVPRQDKTALYVAQPHAHEPATTAGMIDMIEQLVTGKDLLGNPTRLDVEKVLQKVLITFNPIGNPYGRENAPQLYWDGTAVTNQQFWCVMRGEDPQEAGKSWHRYDIFDTREVEVPDPVGIVYEPIDEHRFVEPNRSQLSTYFKLFHHMDAKYQYQYWLDLHQTEFPDSPTQCLILLPLEELPTAEIKQRNAIWAREITDAWREAGCVAEDPMPLPYTGTQAKYFVRNWRAIDQRLCRVTTEVKNNGRDFSPQQQLEAQALSIEVTLRLLSR